MSSTNPAPAAAAREAARRRLRRLTLGLGLTGAAAVALLGGVAAATLPGRSDASAASPGSPPSGTNDDRTIGTDQGIQAAPAAPSTGSGIAHAVSGGSR